MTVYSGNNRRGRIRVPQHTHPLVRRLIVEMNEQRATFAEVSKRSGVAVDTIRFWPTRAMPRLDLFDAALGALGLELTVREKQDPA
jgi:hypothetical protein